MATPVVLQPRNASASSNQSGEHTIATSNSAFASEPGPLQAPDGFDAMDDDPIYSSASSLNVARATPQALGIGRMLDELSRSHRIVVRLGLFVLFVSFAAISFFVWFLARTSSSVVVPTPVNETRTKLSAGVRVMSPRASASPAPAPAPAESAHSTIEEAAPAEASSIKLQTDSRVQEAPAKSRKPRRNADSTAQHYGI